MLSEAPLFKQFKKKPVIGVKNIGHKDLIFKFCNIAFTNALLQKFRKTFVI